MEYGATSGSCVVALKQTIVVGFLVIVMASWTLADECGADGGRGLINSCLRTYFNETGRRIPPELAALVNGKEAKRHVRAIRSEGTTSSSSSTTAATVASTSSYATPRTDMAVPFNTRWCRPFTAFQSCLVESSRHCSAARTVACRVMDCFIAIYGGSFCTDWQLESPAQGRRKLCSEALAAVSSTEPNANRGRSNIIFGCRCHATLLYVSMLVYVGRHH